MSSLAISRAAASASIEQRISPQEQLWLLRQPIQDEIFIASHTDTAGNITGRGLRGYAPQLVAQYAFEDPVLTNWHTSLERLGALPEKIPALPRNINQILEGKCPIYADQKKPDGTSYRVRDTHILTLVPQELGTLIKLATLVKLYGENKLLNPNPFRFENFWREARMEHGDVPFEPTHWELMTKDVLPGSRDQSYTEQAAMVAALSCKAFVNYEVPSVKGTVAALFLHKVATEESLYRSEDAWWRLSPRWTCTRVQEITNNSRLMAGSFAPGGLSVVNSGSGHDYIGVGAVRKF